MYKTPLAIAGAVLLAAFAAGAQVNAPEPASVPHLEKRGNATQLMVDGRPYLALAAELANSASSNLARSVRFLPDRWRDPRCQEA